MESTLHRQLKALYATDPAAREVRIDGFRIDACRDGELVEIQSAPLGALRDKVARLLERHRVRIVKPLYARTRIVQRDAVGGEVLSARFSPARRDARSVFLELVHFATVFPHPRLVLELLLVEIEETRVPCRRRRRGRTRTTADRELLAVVGRVELRTAADLRGLLPDDLPATWTTADLATASGMPRWLAQKAAYCLRRTGAAVVEGKAGRSIAYRWVGPLRVPRTRRRRAA
jgi:hypothetical protein